MTENRLLRTIARPKTWTWPPPRRRRASRCDLAAEGNGVSAVTAREFARRPACKFAYRRWVSSHANARAVPHGPPSKPLNSTGVPLLQTVVCNTICQFPISTMSTPKIHWGTWRSGGMLNSFRQAGQKFGPSRLRRCETFAAQYGQSRRIADHLGRAKTRLIHSTLSTEKA